MTELNWLFVAAIFFGAFFAAAAGRNRLVRREIAPPKEQRPTNVVKI